jgi:hypothetical protein
MQTTKYKVKCQQPEEKTRLGPVPFRRLLFGIGAGGRYGETTTTGMATLHVPTRMMAGLATT